MRFCYGCNRVQLSAILASKVCKSTVPQTFQGVVSLLIGDNAFLSMFLESTFGIGLPDTWSYWWFSKTLHFYVQNGNHQ